MTSKYFVGLDIASESFFACVLMSPTQIHLAPRAFDNDPLGIAALVEWLQAHQLTPAETVVCMEATGVYGEAVAYQLHAQGWWLAVHSPLEIKRAFYPVGHKNDAVDSRQIAEYAVRYQDRLRQWQPKPELLAQIQALLQLREQYVRQKTAHKNALRAAKRKQVRTPLAEQLLQESIQQLERNIDTLVKEIRRLFKQDDDLQRNLHLLISIPGVGLLLAAHALVMMEQLQEPLNPKVLAAYLGISPYEHTSGKSVRKRATSRHFGPATMRKLIHLGARSLRTHHAGFRHYFERKVAEGKKKRLVINSIGNKLVRIICAVIREQQPYIPGYRSVNPLLLPKPLTGSSYSG
jgi:transposase